MATPTITSATFDQAAYAPGAPIKLTVLHSDTDRQTLTVNVSVTDSSGNTSAPSTVTCQIDQGTVNVSSSPTRVWAFVPGESTAGKAVFTTTA